MKGFKPVEPKYGKQFGAAGIRLCCRDGKKVDIDVTTSGVTMFFFDLDLTDFVLDIRRIEQNKIFDPHKYIDYSPYEGMTMQKGFHGMAVIDMTQSELPEFLKYANDFIHEVKMRKNEKAA